MKRKLKKKPLLIVGSGGHFKSCIDIIEESKIFYIYGLVSKYDKIGKKIHGYEVLSQSDDYKKFFNLGIKNAFIAVGQIHNANIRKKIFIKLKKNLFNLPSFISASSSVSKNVTIQEGTIVHKNCYIGRDVKIGKCNIINSAAVIEHDCKVGDFCHLSTSITVNGNVEIGSETFIGSGSVLSNNIKIKKKTFIKMLSRVVNSIK
jgi:sugar O-acyltransferase (sialic acid O-acetyltransferase NeuD family)